MSPQPAPDEDLFGNKTDAQKRVELTQAFMVFLRTLEDSPMNMWDDTDIIDNLTKISSAIKKEEVTDHLCVDLFKKVLFR